MSNATVVSILSAERSTTTLAAAPGLCELRHTFAAQECIDCESNMRQYGSFCSCGVHERVVARLRGG